jgi:hypothetical protein
MISFNNYYFLSRMCNNLTLFLRIIVFNFIHVLGLIWDTLGLILIWVDVNPLGQLGFTLSQV